MKNEFNCTVAEVRDLGQTWKLDIPCWTLDIVARACKGAKVLNYALLSVMVGMMSLSMSTMAAPIDPARSQALLKTLSTPDAAFYDKARACQQAGEFGTVELVPSLAALLSDEKLSAYARSGLENISDPSAAAALRNALGSLKGDLLAGVINSLGVIRDEKAVPALQKLAADTKNGVSKDALLALGKIADESACKTLLQALKSGSKESRAHAASGCLLAAQYKMEVGGSAEARKLYEAVNVADIPAVFKAGAVRGMIAARSSEGPAFLVQQLISSDAEVRKAARLAAQDFCDKAVVAALCNALNTEAAEKQDFIDEALQSLYFKRMITGKRFQDWEGDTKNSFRMKKDAIVAGNLKEKIPQNEFLATTREYTNFILRAESKLLGECNAGIQFRTQRIPNHHEVKGYQADMSTGKDGGYWGKLYDESRRKKLLGESLNRPAMVKSLKPDDWNQYEIRCEGKRIQLFVNGIKTLDYTEADAAIPQFGIIAVQIHSGPPSQAWYRNIQIVELP